MYDRGGVDEMSITISYEKPIDRSLLWGIYAWRCLVYEGPNKDMTGKARLPTTVVTLMLRNLKIRNEHELRIE